MTIRKCRAERQLSARLPFSLALSFGQTKERAKEFLQRQKKEEGKGLLISAA
jgi:hypothetical protein